MWLKCAIIVIDTFISLASSFLHSFFSFFHMCFISFFCFCFFFVLFILPHTHTHTHRIQSKRNTEKLLCLIFYNPIANSNQTEQMGFLSPDRLKHLQSHQQFVFFIINISRNNRRTKKISLSRANRNLVQSVKMKQYKAATTTTMMMMTAIATRSFPIDMRQD